jgi:phosphate starvation-inducible membrane PsiE
MELQFAFKKNLRAAAEGVQRSRCLVLRLLRVMMMVMVLFVMAFRKCRSCQCAKQDTSQHECEGLLLHYFLLFVMLLLGRAR